MSPKYPEGAIIVKGNLLKAKVLGRAGQVCFAQIIKGIIRSDEELFYKSVELMEEEGWAVEETSWVPKEGEEFEYVDLRCQVIKTTNDKADCDSALIESGNCYKPGTGQAQAAAIRVKAAYKGE